MKHQEEPNHLANRFHRDHQRFTRSLFDLLEAVRANDSAAVRSAAEQTDRVAGPHIEFEENVLYPAVAKSHGEEFAARMYAEHAQVLRAVRTLLRLAPKTPIPERVRHDASRDLEVGLRHVESCGTLVSHFQRMSPQETADALNRMEEFDRAAHRWSELPPHPKAVTEEQPR